MSTSSSNPTTHLPPALSVTPAHSTYDSHESPVSPTDTDHSLEVVMVRLVRRASKSNDFSAISTFISDHGVDFSLSLSQRWTLLHEASYAFRGSPNLVRCLLNEGAHVDARDIFMRTPLHMACLDGNPDVIQILLDANADVNAQDEGGATPLHNCAGCCGIPTVSLLLHYLADPHIRDDDNRTPLDLAKFHRNAYLHSLLLSAMHYPLSPAPPSATVPKDALIRAFENGFPTIVEYILNSGVDVNFVDDFGMTPLHTALWLSENVPIVHLLLEHGADPNAVVTASKLTPLHYAIRDHKSPITYVMLLTKHGANVNSVDEFGRSPLHYAVVSRCLPTITHLLHAGADPNAVSTHRKYTPLDLAHQTDSSFYDLLRTAMATHTTIPLSLPSLSSPTTHLPPAPPALSATPTHSTDDSREE